MVVVEGDIRGETPTHIHALISAPFASSSTWLNLRWAAGWASVREYDQTRGGAEYIMKQVATGRSEWDISDVLVEVV